MVLGHPETPVSGNGYNDTAFFSPSSFPCLFYLVDTIGQ